MTVVGISVDSQPGNKLPPFFIFTAFDDCRLTDCECQEWHQFLHHEEAVRDDRKVA
jgi:hypothetical protein